LYFLDPERGARRRSYLRDRMIHVEHAGADLLSKANRDIAQRARGVVSALSHLSREQVSDDVLVERVRAKLGRWTSHPHAIRVDANDGIVTLSGPILADEKPRLLARIERVRGVGKVQDSLAAHSSPDGVPSLQSGGPTARRPSHRLGIVDENWPPSFRVGAALAGVALGAGAARRGRGLPAALMLAFGTALLVRAVTNLPPKRLIGAGAGRRAIDLHKTISVQAPIDEVFALLANFEQFPASWITCATFGSPVEGGRAGPSRGP
jgi:hypothetical protein